MSDGAPILTATQHTRTRKFALLCSGTIKNGRFNRVSPDFMNTVDAGVEKLRREIKEKYKSVTFPDICDTEDPHCSTPVFLTKHERDAIIREIEYMIGRMIQRKVERMPSVGKTLT